MGLTFAELTESPVGPLSFVAGDRGLQRVAFARLYEFKKQHGITESSPSLEGLGTIGVLFAEVNEYLFGIRKTFSVAIDWYVVDGFQQEVLVLTAEIPFGTLMTYGEVASKLGKPGASRAVGGALGANPMPIVIPCHRVIGTDHKLRGYTDGIATKAFLLGLEGHLVEGDMVRTD